MLPTLPNPPYKKQETTTYICYVNWQFKNGYLNIKLLGVLIDNIFVLFGGRVI